VPDKKGRYWPRKKKENSTMNKQQESTPQEIGLEVRTFPIAEPRGNTLAYANATIGGIVAVHGIRVMNSDKGIFVAMPSAKDAGGKFRDICHPIVPGLRQQLNEAVLSDYSTALEKQAQKIASVRGQIQEGKKRLEAERTEGKDKAPSKTDQER